VRSPATSSLRLRAAAGGSSDGVERQEPQVRVAPLGQRADEMPPEETHGARDEDAPAVQFLERH
jgi:hypothetical protein